MCESRHMYPSMGQLVFRVNQKYKKIHSAINNVWLRTGLVVGGKYRQAHLGHKTRVRKKTIVLNCYSLKNLPNLIELLEFSRK